MSQLARPPPAAAFLSVRPTSSLKGFSVSTFPSVSELPSPQTSPEAFEAALETLLLRAELQTCEIIERFRAILNKLPLSAAFLRSEQWRSLVGDPLLAENRTRTSDIKARLEELGSPAT